MTNIKGKAAVPTFTNVMRSGLFHRNLNKYLRMSYSNLIDRVTRFVNAEEAGKMKKMKKSVEVGVKKHPGLWPTTMGQD